MGEQERRRYPKAQEGVTLETVITEALARYAKGYAVSTFKGTMPSPEGIFTTWHFTKAYQLLVVHEDLHPTTVAWMLRSARNVESLPGQHWRVHRGLIKRIAWFFNSSECVHCTRWVPDPAPPYSDPYLCHECSREFELRKNA